MDDYKNEKISLEKKFAKKLGMGATAQKLFDNFDENSSDIILDIENIEFISRSFAQEYIYKKNKSKANVREINMSNFVKDMLDAVNFDFEKISS
jgi:hypothetical protein